MNIQKLLELNHNLHYINDENLLKQEFKKFLTEGEIFTKLENELLRHQTIHFPYSLDSSSFINEIQKEIITSFVFCIYESYKGEVSIQIADIYGVNGGDSGQTLALILEGENGLIQYLENNDYSISGFSSNTISVEAEDYLPLSKQLESFGIIRFDETIHKDAYITQESIETKKQHKSSPI